MIDLFFGVALGVLSCQFWSTVLPFGSLLQIYTSYGIRNTATTGPSSQWCQFFNWGCVWVWSWTSSLCRSIIYAVQDQVWPDAPSLWRSICALCAYPGYTRCFDLTSVYLCASSLQTSQYHRTFIPLSVSLWNDLVDPVFDDVGLAGFKSMSNAFLLALLLSPFLSSTIFSFSSFPLYSS